MKYIVINIIAVFIGLFYFDIIAQPSVMPNDSIANVIKLKGLRSKKSRLEKEIRVQDGKRNVQIAGVTPETLETLNNRQDSICLALRSQLVDVILEIKELSPEVTTSQLLQQYYNINRKEETTVKEDENYQ